MQSPPRSWLDAMTTSPLGGAASTAIDHVGNRGQRGEHPNDDDRPLVTTPLAAVTEEEVVVAEVAAAWAGARAAASRP